MFQIRQSGIPGISRRACYRLTPKGLILIRLIRYAAPVLLRRFDDLSPLKTLSKYYACILYGNGVLSLDVTEILHKSAL